jgi:thymidylate synthase (FAD)
MNTAEIVAVTESWINTKDGNMTADEFIAYVARVSNPGNQMNSESAPKLLRYLVKHNHWSPFEMVDVVMEINTTRDIGRQVLRHRSFSFQEFSQRYADPTKDMGFVMREARLQDTKNRQNSVETDDESLQNEWEEYQATVLDEARIAYVWAIQNGIAKEQARSVLPEGLTMSRMYMKGSLRSWIHYCQVRMDISTQKEHRELALAAWEEIVKVFPSLSDVFQQEAK